MVEVEVAKYRSERYTQLTKARVYSWPIIPLFAQNGGFVGHKNGGKLLPKS